MAYQPLARKYRPHTFEELVGQEGVAKALGNSITLGREPHAVIFSGVRGIGKTTTARLYAKALNCDQGPTPTPCGQCESCTAIVEGRHEDVLEIDGASNTGVDDVRALRETVSYIPQRSKYKVYIIDEVHMLSQSAFNALLKTLEEPPPHVVFVFATTELNRIPQTIISRCQTFYLRKFSAKEIVTRLKAILEAEGLVYSEKALALIAKEGHGSMRDALTLLDQGIALGNGEVTEVALEGLITSVSTSVCMGILDALVDKQPQVAMELVAKSDQQGVSYEALVEEVARFARHGFVVKDLGRAALEIELLGLDDQELEQLEEIAGKASVMDLNRIFRTLVKCRSDLDGSLLDRYVLENYLMEWCFDPGLPTIESLEQGRRPVAAAAARGASAETATSQVERKRERRPGGKGRLLDQIKQRNPAERESPVVNALVVDSGKDQSAAPVAPRREVPSFPGSWRELVDMWKQRKPMQARVLEDTYLVKYGPDEIHVQVAEKSMAAGKLLQPGTLQRVEAAFKDMFGFEGSFRVSKKVEGAQKQENEVKPSVDQKETLLDIKAREKDNEKRRLIEEVTSDPLTQGLIETLGAEIDGVVIE